MKSINTIISHSLIKYAVKIIKRNREAEFESYNVALLNNKNPLKKIEVAAEQLRRLFFTTC